MKSKNDSVSCYLYSVNSGKYFWYKVCGLFLATLLATSLIVQDCYASEVKTSKKVLVLYSYSSDIPVQALFTTGLQKEFKHSFSERIDYVYEYLETGRYSLDRKFSENLSKFLQVKYMVEPPSLIITHFSPAADFMIKYGEKTFPGVPAVLAFYDREQEPHENLPVNYYDVAGIYGMKSAVELIMQAQPGTRKIYVIAGDSKREREVIAQFNDDVTSFSRELEFVYLNKLSFKQMLETVKDIEQNSVIFYIFLFKDVDGNSFIPVQALKKLTEVAPVPIYGAISSFVGQGSIGGYMASQEMLGRKVGEVAANILNGNIDNNPVISKKLAAEYIFDGRELKRWGIDEKKLPVESRILYKEPTIWEAYRFYVIAAVVLTLLEAGLVLLLLVNRFRRKKAEQEIIKLNVQLVDNIKIQQEINSTLEEEIMERQATEENLHETRVILQAALDNCQAGIAIVDAPNGKIRYLNKAGLLITNQSEEFFSRDFTDYLADSNIVHEDGTPFKDDEIPIVRAICYGEACSEEFVVRRENCNDLAIWANAAPIKDEAGKVTAGIIIFLDISERKEIEKALLKAKEQAEQANAAKSQFLANMSHEIRTPMNGIIGMTDITLMTDLQAKQREYLNIVKNSTISLLRVLNDILDYSKIEAGKIDLEEAEFDVRNTTNEVIDLFSIVAKQKGLEIKQNITKEIPRTIIGDAIRLRQVLSNLVGNGVKFTEQGEIAINIDVVEKYQNKVKLRFVVADTGLGISDDKLDKLFKRFSQVDDSNTRKFGGTGLGLAISKKLIEIMGGEIGVESEAGKGSSFFFTAIFEFLEDNIKNSTAESGENVPISYDNEDFKNILVVEDDEISRNVVIFMLQKMGVLVTAVENGLEAISAFEKRKFDLILMDVNMPYMDGYSATQAIRLKEKKLNSHTPIIAMTAYALKGDSEKCLQAGMDDYISKPINLNETMAIIESYIHKVRRGD